VHFRLKSRHQHDSQNQINVEIGKKLPEIDKYPVSICAVERLDDFDPEIHCHLSPCSRI